MESDIELRHLRREVKTAVEMAIVELAPAKLVERLASVAGLLEALSELPHNCPPALALTPTVTASGKAALAEWRKWEQAHVKKASA